MRIHMKSKMYEELEVKIASYISMVENHLSSDCSSTKHLAVTQLNGNSSVYELNYSGFREERQYIDYLGFRHGSLGGVLKLSSSQQLLWQIEVDQNGRMVPSFGNCCLKQQQQQFMGLPLIVLILETLDIQVNAVRSAEKCLVQSSAFHTQKLLSVKL
ncbi:hypothetical protein BTVI_157727 [Pitangus sulphuratus]|nr:hypothetical protein BTVI_157727 [Pitangus sulphuratus]